MGTERKAACEGDHEGGDGRESGEAHRLRYQVLGERERRDECRGKASLLLLEQYEPPDKEGAEGCGIGEDQSGGHRAQRFGACHTGKLGERDGIDGRDDCVGGVEAVAELQAQVRETDSSEAEQ